MKSFLKNIFKGPVCVALLLSVLLTASVSGSEANQDSADSSSSFKNSLEMDEINLLPLFYHNKEKTWILPTFYSDNKRMLVLPFFFSEYSPNNKQMLVLPFFFSEYSPDRITELDVLLLLYNYEYDPESARHRHDILAPYLLRYETYENSPKSYLSLLLRLYTYDNGVHNILGGLLFHYKGYENPNKYFLSVLAGLLWSSRQAEDMSEIRVLGGSLFRSIKNSEKHRTSLLLFSYTRYLNDVKGDSWSFCWGLLEKHDGGGHIFYIPYGKSEE